jgi:hypothetical protein
MTTPTALDAAKKPSHTPTPLPWELQDVPSLGIAEITAWTGENHVVVAELDHDCRLVDGAFIVRACNEYEALRKLYVAAQTIKAKLCSETEVVTGADTINLMQAIEAVDVIARASEVS